MSVPFDKVEGKKVDLNKQSHRDEVIRRNKALDKALNDGIYIEEFQINITIGVEYDCVKMRNTIR